MNYLLLHLLFLCHLLGDFSHLSRPKMLAAKKYGTPLMPIFHHALVHAFLMGVILMMFTTIGLAIGGFAIQLAAHFLIDVSKGIVNKKFPIVLDHTKYPYWYVFGIDQFLHAATIFLIVLIVK